MRYFEASGLCSIKDYQEGEPHRIMAADLFVDELYMLMLAVKSIRSSRGAARYPSRLMNIEHTESGVSVVEFAVLDDDFHTQMTTDGTIGDGFWIDAPQKIIVDELPVRKGYFKGYDDSFDGDPRLSVVRHPLELSSTI